jgi:hypothetical protein
LPNSQKKDRNWKNIHLGITHNKTSVDFSNSVRRKNEGRTNCTGARNKKGNKEIKMVVVLGIVSMILIFTEKYLRLHV